MSYSSTVYRPPSFTSNYPSNVRTDADKALWEIERAIRSMAEAKDFLVRVSAEERAVLATGVRDLIYDAAKLLQWMEGRADSPTD